MPRSSWLIAFADLSAVLCAFFVLMLAMSDFDAPALDRIATVFGKNEGEWARQRPEAVQPVGAVRRTAVDGEQAHDYLATVVEGRLRRGDWPWTVQRQADGVALHQTLQPGGARIPDEMASYLRSAGYPIRVSALIGGDGAQRARSVGAFDDGLRAAQALADRLVMLGVADEVPVSTRFSGDRSPMTIEILLDAGQEGQ
ncbi:flagellar motor protein MotB [Minwuia sp.]|uniref:flagellar motor protein MotB n=1 Tax=Minwuia sp. TaxID=2493630 RepID=UPI003A936E2A